MKLDAPGIIVLTIAVISVPGGTMYLSVRRAGKVTPRRDNKTYVAIRQSPHASTRASCHGQDLEGQSSWRERDPDGLLPAPPHDAIGHMWDRPDEVLFKPTKFGIRPFAGLHYRSAMPVFLDQDSDDDILAGLPDVKSTWPPEIRRRQDTINQASRQQQ